MDKRRTSRRKRIGRPNRRSRRRNIERSNRRSRSRSKSRNKKRSGQRSRGRSGRGRGRGRGRRKEGGGSKSKIRTRSPSPSRSRWTDDHVPSYDDMVAKTYKQRKRGSWKTCITSILMVFIVMVYISGIFDYGKTIDDYITINEDGLDIAEKLGVGLIEYDSNIDRILNDMLKKMDRASSAEENVQNAISYNLRLNDNMQIDNINPYLIDNRGTVADQPLAVADLGSVDLGTRDAIGFYDTRKQAKQLRGDWRPYKNLQQSFIDQNDINIMLEKFMPKILSMANTGIPYNIQFSGGSQLVRRDPFGPQNFHQDIDQLALVGSAAADHEYRIMIFDRYEIYDTSWTEIATEIDDRRANRFVKSQFPRYDFAKLIDFDVNRSEYIALIFDNNKVFHRTPPTAFWDWVTNNIPDKRRVTQFRISWDDYDQLDYEDVFNEKRFQEIMSGGGYRIM